MPTHKWIVLFTFTPQFIRGTYEYYTGELSINTAET